jgi:hypothetical protein
MWTKAPRGGGSIGREVRRSERVRVDTSPELSHIEHTSQCTHARMHTYVHVTCTCILLQVRCSLIPAIHESYRRLDFCLLAGHRSCLSSFLLSSATQPFSVIQYVSIYMYMNMFVYMSRLDI